MSIFSWFRKRPIVKDFKGRDITPSDVKLAVIRSARKYPNIQNDGHWICAPVVAWLLETTAYVNVVHMERSVDENTIPKMKKKHFADTLAGLPITAQWEAEPDTLKLYNKKGRVVYIAQNIGSATVIAQTLRQQGRPRGISLHSRAKRLNNEELNMDGWDD